MAFNRANISTTSTFERSGTITTSDTPAFQLWSNVSNPALQKWDLGKGFTLDTNSTTKELNFNYNNEVILTIASTGLSNFEQTTLNLNNYNSFPLSAQMGEMANVQGYLYVWTD